MQLAGAPCVRTKNATAYAYQTRSMRVFSFQTQPYLPDEEHRSICLPDEQCQGMFYPNAAVSSRRSCVIWTQPWLLVVAYGFLTCGPTLQIGGIAVMVAA
jgi:hypothetical protein